MKTMKKFWKYFLNFIIFFLLVTGLTYWGTFNSNKNNTKIQYIVQESSPVIEIKECTKKKIIGTATNDMGVLINVIYIKADFYDPNNKLLGTKYDEIKYFNVGEKSKFEINFKFKNVAKIEVTATETNE